MEALKLLTWILKKWKAVFKKYEVYAFDLTSLNKDLIVYAMTNDNPCVYKQRTR